MRSGTGLSRYGVTPLMELLNDLENQLERQIPAQLPTALQQALDDYRPVGPDG